ncbi:hypothetical protein [Roseibium sp. Sym1]|uniref:hypothetical protein n=1 Tax=Roseibium sp. Sym1 TaxID=3016006 RepID=UPI0022B46C7A|nr:hypothetical protein [Roseibium sp. Sym1]
MTFSRPMLALADAVLYVVLTLGFAVVWHLKLFAPLYVSLNWPSPEDADVPLGFVAIVTQAIILGVLFQSVVEGRGLGRAIAMLCGTAFVFLWSSHVIGDAAKCGFLPKSTFVAVETLYLAIQFVLFGVALALVHRWLDPRCRPRAS